MKDAKLFSDKEFYGKLWKLAFPIALQNLMLATVAAMDALMLGSLDQNAMSGVSLATQVQFIQNMFLGAIVSGIVILGAQYWGKGDRKTLNDIFCMSLKLNGLISIAFFLACLLFPRQLMLIFTNEEVLIGIGVRYLKIAGWSYLLTGFSQCYLAVMKVSDHAAQAARVSVAISLLDIVLNAVFIFGLLGIPAMGVEGAASSTVFSRMLELTWVVILSYKKSYIHPDLRRFFSKNQLLAKDFAKCTLPILGASLAWGVGFTSYSAFMGHLGTDATAANSVAAVIRDMVCCLCNGLASGGGILVGNELGAGNLKKGKLYGDRLVVLSFITGILSTGLMLVVTPVILHFVKLTGGARRYLLGMLLIMAFYMIGRAVNTIIINGIFAAGGDTMFDLYSVALTMWCLAIPLAAAGTFFLHWPVLVVYACTCLDEVGIIPWVLIHYRKNKWVKDLTHQELSSRS